MWENHILSGKDLIIHCLPNSIEKIWLIKDFFYPFLPLVLSILN